MRLQDFSYFLEDFELSRYWLPSILSANFIQLKAKFKTTLKRSHVSYQKLCSRSPLLISNSARFFKYLSHDFFTQIVSEYRTSKYNFFENETFCFHLGSRCCSIWRVRDNCLPSPGVPRGSGLDKN